MKCPRCHAKNIEGAMRCIVCGVVFEHGMQQALKEAGQPFEIPDEDKDKDKDWERRFLESWLTAKTAASLEHKLFRFKVWYDESVPHFVAYCLLLLVLLVIGFYVVVRRYPEWDVWGLRGQPQLKEEVNVYE